MVTTVARTDACHLDLASANSWSGFSTWWQARTPSTGGYGPECGSSRGSQAVPARCVRQAGPAPAFAWKGGPRGEWERPTAPPDRGGPGDSDAI
jgi:hypothetical protein